VDSHLGSPLLHPLLAGRWSPARFDTSHVIADDEVESLLYVEGTDWEYSEFSLYDLGQAVAHISLQAEALGLAARQFRAFDRDGVAAEFAVPPHWEVTTMTAIGLAAGRQQPGRAGARAGGPLRQRRAVSDIVWSAG
jgi:hypothetical protein